MEFHIKHPKSGRTIIMRGDEPPQEADIDAAFAQLDSMDMERQKQEALRKLGDEYSSLDKALIGAGRGVADVLQGGKQMYLEAFGTDEEAEKYRQELAEEERLYQGGMGDSGWAMAGRIGGNIGATVIPGGMALRGAAAVPGLARGAVALRGLSAAKQAAIGGGLAAGMNPVLDDDFVTGKVKQVATGAALGAGAAKLIEKGVGAAEKIFNAPKSVWNEGVRRTVNEGSEQALEGARLEAATGVPLTIGERTGSRLAKAAENMARQHPLSADNALQVDLAKSDAIKGYLNRIMDDMSQGNYSAASMGEKVRSTVRGAVDDLLSKQRAQAAKDYGVVRTAAGGDPKVMMPNLVAEARAVFDDLDGVAGSGATRIKDELSNYIGALTRGQGDELAEISLNAAMKNRSALSNATKGTGQIFKDLDTRQQRAIASRLLSAAEKDFDEIAVQGGSLGDLLKTANQNYRAYAQAIEGVEKSPLGRLLGEEVADNIATGSFNRIAPEKIVQRFRSMTPSEVKLSADMLEKHSPEVLNDLRRYWIADALEKSMDAAPSAGQLARDAINPNRFISTLAKNGEEFDKLKALYTPEQLAKMDDAFNVMRRWSDKFGYNFSGTAPQLELLSVIKDVSLPGLARSTGSLAGRMMMLKRVVASMADPKVTNLILKNRNLPRGEAGLQQVAGILAAVYGTRELTTPEGGQSPTQPSGM